MKQPEPKTLIRILKAENKDLRYNKDSITRQIKENNNSLKDLKAGKTDNISNINYRFAKKLQDIVSKWVSNEFNYVQVDTLEAETDNNLFGYIRQDTTAGDYINSRNAEDLREKLIDYFRERFMSSVVELTPKDITREKRLINAFNKSENKDFESIEELLCENVNDYVPNDFIDWINDSEDYQNWRDQEEQDNYPMWSTCFEFNEEPPEDWKQHAKDSGFGLIEGLGEHNTILFVAGCGYSFYSSHWIPLYLRIFKEDAKKYAGINYQMV